MSRPLSTYVYADDPILEAGVVSQLRPRAEVEVVGSAGLHGADVAIAVADVLDDATVRILRSLRKAGVRHTLLVLGAVDHETVTTAAEAGVSGVLRRTQATSDVLVRTVGDVAAGRRVLPRDLLDRTGGTPRRTGTPHLDKLSQREADVLRLVAEGLDTDEIARTLCYSQRTVKNVLHGVTTRLQLRNRSHAVAYAVREGLI
ncbi:LuxR C-terminal-related transcriptional regulator [Mycobacterium sp. NPDC050041]|uniref:response regulator transcription factor n=1 Tax=Mycobacterium sp. NPDC050041 TaxID=3364293 RepID=UPI003C2AAE9C